MPPTPTTRSCRGARCWRRRPRSRRHLPGRPVPPPLAAPRSPPRDRPRPGFPHVHRARYSPHARSPDDRARRRVWGVLPRPHHGRALRRGGEPARRGPYQNRAARPRRRDRNARGQFPRGSLRRLLRSRSHHHRHQLQLALGPARDEPRQDRRRDAGDGAVLVRTVRARFRGGRGEGGRGGGGTLRRDESDGSEGGGGRVLQPGGRSGYEPGWGARRRTSPRGSDVRVHDVGHPARRRADLRLETDSRTSSVP